MPEAQHNELGVVDPVQRLPPIRASPPSVRRSELQRRAQQKLKEATYVHVVLKAVRSTIHNDRWMREHDCPNLHHVWRLWLEAAAAAARAESACDTGDHGASPSVSAPHVRSGAARRGPPGVTAGHGIIPTGGASGVGSGARLEPLHRKAGGNPTAALYNREAAAAAAAAARIRSSSYSRTHGTSISPPALRSLSVPSARPPACRSPTSQHHASPHLLRPPPPRGLNNLRGGHGGGAAPALAPAAAAKLDVAGLRAALAATFPNGATLSLHEVQMVYNSLDPTGRGHVTLSTFSSVFARPRREASQGDVPFYLELPTWGATVGGCIDRDARGGLKHSTSDVTLQHGRGGSEIRPGELRGVAAGFGLGHEGFGDKSSLGYELIAHSNLNANVLKWGTGCVASREPPLPQRRSPPKQRQPPKSKHAEKLPPPPRPRGVRLEEMERRFRWFMARQLQRAYRAHLREARRRYAAACKLQASALRRQAERLYSELRRSSIHVQRLARGLLKRLRYAAARREIRMLQMNAAIVIQRQAQRRSFRRVVARVRIQRSFRAHLCRRLLKSLMAAKTARDERERMDAAMARAEQEAARLRGLGGI